MVRLLLIKSPSQSKSQPTHISLELKQLNGAMPQGSWLGPLSFLALINDLTTGCLIHKYVDDTTLSEVLESKNQDSHMQAFIENLLDWADRNDMQVNTAKTKEI